MCIMESKNATFIELTMNPRREGSGETEPHYFCKFRIDLDTDISWQIDVYRYRSLINTETIQVVQQSSLNTHYNDKYLRERSYIYRDNGIGNTTSHAKIDVKRSAHTVNVYVRNNLRIRGNSFRIFVQ